MSTCIRTQDLSIGHVSPKGDPLVLAKDLRLSCRKGELLALVGPNGCGKSTLLRTLSGLHEPLQGKVLIDNESIEERSPKERARLLSIVLTNTRAPTDLSVHELTSLGRSPYQSPFMPLSKEDHRIIEQAIEQVGIGHLAHQTLDTLSDGEAQKAMIARALAQRTKAVILDEPTAHLDLVNRVEIARMLRELARERQEAIVMASHDLETILRIVDRVWLMNRNGTIQEGIPEELAMKGAFTEVFSSEKLEFDRNTGTFKFLADTGRTLNIHGEGLEAFWTRRALERIGFRTKVKASEPGEADIHIKEGIWAYAGTHHHSLEDLVRSLPSLDA